MESYGDLIEGSPLWRGAREDATRTLELEWSLGQLGPRDAPEALRVFRPLRCSRQKSKRA